MSDWARDDLELYVKCPACGRQMRTGNYVCGHCAAIGKTETPKLMTNEPEYMPIKRHHCDGDLCSTCEMNERCRERVKRELWLMCEIPDERDIMRVELLQQEMRL